MEVGLRPEDVGSSPTTTPARCPSTSSSSRWAQLFTASSPASHSSAQAATGDVAAQEPALDAVDPDKVHVFHPRPGRGWSRTETGPSSHRHSGLIAARPETGDETNGASRREIRHQCVEQQHTPPASPRQPPCGASATSSIRPATRLASSARPDSALNTAGSMPSTRRSPISGYSSPCASRSAYRPRRGRPSRLDPFEPDFRTLLSQMRPYGLAPSPAGHGRQRRSGIFAIMPVDEVVPAFRAGAAHGSRSRSGRPCFAVISASSRRARRRCRGQEWRACGANNRSKAVPELDGELVERNARQHD